MYKHLHVWEEGRGFGTVGQYLLKGVRYTGAAEQIIVRDIWRGREMTEREKLALRLNIQWQRAAVCVILLVETNHLHWGNPWSGWRCICLETRRSRWCPAGKTATHCNPASTQNQKGCSIYSIRPRCPISSGAAEWNWLLQRSVLDSLSNNTGYFVSQHCYHPEQKPSTQAHTLWTTKQQKCVIHLIRAQSDCAECAVLYWPWVKTPFSSSRRSN